MSPVDGVFVLPRAKDLPDRYVRKGELIGYVLDVERPTVRVVVPQSDVDLIRRRVPSARVRLASSLSRVLPAVLRREVPEAAGDLPSTVLGMAGGGSIPVDPRESGGRRSLEKLFQFDLPLPAASRPPYLGGRVYVCFDHGYEPLAWRWYRDLRRLFLRRFVT